MIQNLILVLHKGPIGSDCEGRNPKKAAIELAIIEHSSGGDGDLNAFLMGFLYRFDIFFWNIFKILLSLFLLHYFGPYLFSRPSFFYPSVISIVSISSKFNPIIMIFK